MEHNYLIIDFDGLKSTVRISQRFTEEDHRQVCRGKRLILRIHADDTIEMLQKHGYRSIGQLFSLSDTVETGTAMNSTVKSDNIQE